MLQSDHNVLWVRNRNWAKWKLVAFYLLSPFAWLFGRRAFKPTWARSSPEFLNSK